MGDIVAIEGRVTVDNSGEMRDRLAVALEAQARRGDGRPVASHLH